VVIYGNDKHPPYSSTVVNKPHANSAAEVGLTYQRLTALREYMSKMSKHEDGSATNVIRFLKNYGPVFIWFMVFVFISGAFQIAIPYPPDPDTAYHVVVGRLIHEHGILHSFPWTPFSWLADHYADKELLFHLLFVPLAKVHWITAARIVGTLAGATLLLVLYLILRRENIRLAGIWTLIALSGSLFFIFRFTLVRPHLLSIPLALIFLWSAVRCRFVILSLVSVIYPWAYVAFWQLPFLLLIAAETARFLSDARIRWTPAATAAAGVAFGVAIHPNAVNLLYFNWITMSDIFFKSALGIGEVTELGPELAPYPLEAWILGLSFIVLMVVVSSIYAWRKRRQDILLLSFTLAALGFCALTIKTQRFSEYFVPFSVAAMALTSRWITWRFLPHAILGISMLYTAAEGPGLFSNVLELSDEMPPPVENYLQLQIPKHSQVFTTEWDFTGMLMLALPDRYFMVALDPTLFYKKNPDLYRLWYRIRREAPADSAELIRRYFGARYVLSYNSPAHGELYARLLADPRVRQLLYSESLLLFDLGEPEKQD